MISVVNAKMSDDAVDAAALHNAAADGKVEDVKTLVKCGYGINSLNDGGLYHSSLNRCQFIDSIPSIAIISSLSIASFLPLIAKVFFLVYHHTSFMTCLHP